MRMPARRLRVGELHAVDTTAPGPSEDLPVAQPGEAAPHPGDRLRGQLRGVFEGQDQVFQVGPTGKMNVSLKEAQRPNLATIRAKPVVAAVRSQPLPTA
ncbi:hypothetical protein ES703_77652 [subsurface metagenome]